MGLGINVSVYTDIYVRISTFVIRVITWASFYARKFIFGMLLTQNLIFNSVLELPLCHALGWGWGVNVSIYIDSYVCISLGGHNLGTFYARKFKCGMLLIQT